MVLRMAATHSWKGMFPAPVQTFRQTDWSGTSPGDTCSPSQTWTAAIRSAGRAATQAAHSFSAGTAGAIAPTSFASTVLKSDNMSHQVAKESCWIAVGAGLAGFLEPGSSQIPLDDQEFAGGPGFPDPGCEV